MTYNVNGITGTPARTRTVIKSVKENTTTRVVLPETLLSIRDNGAFEKKDVVNGYLFPLKKTIKLGLMFFKLLRKKPRLIHCFLADSAFVACIYKLFFKCHVVFEVHAVLKIASPINFSFKELVACKLADKLIVMSHKMKEILVCEYKLNPKKIQVIWGPIDLDFFKPTRKSSSKFIVCYGGNDSKYQGVETILKAAKLISKEKGIQFKFVGFDGSKYDKNSNVEFKGKIEKDSDFVKELSDSDLFISAYEGDFATGAYPHKLSTYLSLGKPIIASDISDCRYILEKSKSGKAFPVKDYKSLALVIKTFYSMDKAKFDKMGKNARRFAEEKLDSHKLYAQLEKSYSD